MSNHKSTTDLIEEIRYQHREQQGTEATTTKLLEKFAIIDFEASSLSPSSWPVEIGISFLASGKINTWSSLIRPDKHWNRMDWSEKSAKIHGLSQSELRNAPEASFIVKDFWQKLGDRTLLSDAPEFETRWLTKLLKASRVQAETVPFVGDYHHASFSIFSGYALDIVYETLERRAAPHRAGPDSARLATAWLHALRHESSSA